MRKEKIIDGTGTPLTPSRQGRKCLGNGEHPEYEICCEECDYFLYCFPQYDARLKRNKLKKWVKQLPIFRLFESFIRFIIIMWYKLTRKF